MLFQKAKTQKAKSLNLATITNPTHSEHAKFETFSILNA